MIRKGTVRNKLDIVEKTLNKPATINEQEEISYQEE